MKYKFSFSDIIVGVINFVFSLAILGLLLRFFLRLFGANPGADFTEFIYNSTTPLLDPFQNVFTPYVIEQGNVLEFSTLLAIAAYMFLAYIVIEFIYYIEANTRREERA